MATEFKRVIRDCSLGRKGEDTREKRVKVENIIFLLEINSRTSVGG